MLVEQKRYPHVRPVVSMTGTRYAASFQFRGIKYEQPGFDSPEEASAFADKWKRELLERSNTQAKNQAPDEKQKKPAASNKPKRKKRWLPDQDGWNKLWKEGNLYIYVQNKKVIGAQIRKNGIITNVLICTEYTDGRLFKALPISCSTLRDNLRSGKYVVTDMQRRRIDPELPPVKRNNIDS